MNIKSVLQHTTTSDSPFSLRTYSKNNFMQHNLATDLMERFEKLKKHPLAGFQYLEQLEQEINECKNVLQKFKGKKHLIHVGMGGSVLSPIVLKEAFAPKNDSVIFIDNLDYAYMKEQLKDIDLQDSVIYLVSKSGNTLETQILMNFFLEQYKQIIKTEKNSEEDILKNYFIFATDPQAGPLRSLAEKFKIASLNIPTNLGGRFCAFSCVTFLPGLFLGLKIEDFLQGARLAQKYFESKDKNQTVLKIASKIAEEFSNGINQTVFMPYSSFLRPLSNWFAQLWAESLGKINTDKMRVGLTPIVAYGPSDQHSLLQLFKDGPKNKNYFFISLDNCSMEPFISHPVLIQKKYSDVIKAQMHGTVTSILENNPTLFEITLKSLDLTSLGSLMYFFELLTVCSGASLSVDPFDQPGVEHGKKLTWSILTKNEN